MAVHSAIVNGAKQVCDVSNKEMLELMEITDEIRKQIGKAVTLQQWLLWISCPLTGLSNKQGVTCSSSLCAISGHAPVRTGNNVPDLFLLQNGFLCSRDRDLSFLCRCLLSHGQIDRACQEKPQCFSAYYRQA